MLDTGRGSFGTHRVQATLASIPIDRQACQIDESTQVATARGWWGESMAYNWAKHSGAILSAGISLHYVDMLTAAMLA